MAQNGSKRIKKKSKEASNVKMGSKDSKTTAKRRQYDPQVSPESPQVDPKMVQNHPKMVPFWSPKNGPKMAPGCLKNGSRKMKKTKVKSNQKKTVQKLSRPS